MIIEFLEADLPQLRQLLAGPNASRARAALENLLKAHVEGHHLLVMGHKTGQMLAQAGGFSAAAEGALKITKAKAAFTGNITAIANEVVRIRPSATSTFVTHAGVALRVHEVPLLAYVTSASVQPARLIAESQYDLTVLRSLAEARRRDLAPGLVVRFEALTGGGGNFHAAWGQSVTSHPRPLVGVVDSDRTGPSEPVGTTAKKAEKVDGEHPKGIRVLHVLPCREIENLLPAKLVRAAYASDPSVLAAAAAAEERSELGEARFEDLKATVASSLLETCAKWLSESSPGPIDEVLRLKCNAATEVATLLLSYSIAPRPAL